MPGDWFPVCAKARSKISISQGYAQKTHHTWEQHFKRFWISVLINMFFLPLIFSLKTTRAALVTFQERWEFRNRKTTCSEQHILSLFIITKMSKGGVELIKTQHLSLPSLIGSDQRVSFRTSSREFILGNLASWVF